MKICFLAEINSIHSVRWIRYFVNKGYEVYLISPAANEVDVFKGKKNVKIYSIKNFSHKPLTIIWNIFPVRALIKNIRPDIFHVHCAGVNGVLGALSGFHPFVLTAWGSDVLIGPKSKAKRPLIKFILKKAGLITCDAGHVREVMIRLGANPSKIRIVYFGVDTQNFCPGPKDKNLIQKLAIQNCPVVISLRSFEPIYDVETVIKTIPLVLKEFPKIKFIIAGKGSEEKKLKSLAKTLKVLKSIRFVGWISNNELPEYLRIGDIYVSTALSDAGISSSTAEAMACELPVVITDTGENERWVENGKSGYLVSVKVPEKLSQRIICLLKNERKRKEFGRLARKKIVEKNDYYKEMEKMENIYKNLLTLRTEP